MNFEQFKKWIEAKREAQGRLSKLYELKVDLIDYQDTYAKIETILLEALFNADQVDVLSWWLYEAPSAIEAEPKAFAVVYEQNGQEIDLNGDQKFYDYLMSLKKD